MCSAIGPSAAFSTSKWKPSSAAAAARIPPTVTRTGLSEVGAPNCCGILTMKPSPVPPRISFGFSVSLTIGRPPSVAPAGSSTSSNRPCFTRHQMRPLSSVIVSPCLANVAVPDFVPAPISTPRSP